MFILCINSKWMILYQEYDKIKWYAMYAAEMDAKEGEFLYECKEEYSSFCITWRKRFTGYYKLLVEKLLEILGKYHIDIIFLAGYMRLLHHTVLAQYDNRIFNIHPALLPKYGGNRQRIAFIY